MTLGATIRRMREKAKLTQAELARRLKVSHISVCRWEGDVRAPSLAMRYRVARACKADPAPLLSEAVVRKAG